MKNKVSPIGEIFQGASYHGEGLSPPLVSNCTLLLQDSTSEFRDSGIDGQIDGIDGIDSGIEGQEVFIDGIDGQEGEAQLDSLHR